MEYRQKFNVVGKSPWPSHGGFVREFIVSKRGAIFRHATMAGGYMALGLQHYWLVVWNIWITVFVHTLGIHHPNWPTPSFFRGVGHVNHQPGYRFFMETMNGKENSMELFG